MNDLIKSLLFGIFIIKRCEEFSLTSFGNLKHKLSNKDNWNV